MNNINYFKKEISNYLLHTQMMMKMKKEELSFYIGKKEIRIILKNNYKYTGKIIELMQDSLRFDDRFEGIVTIPYEEIRLVSEISKHKWKDIGDFRSDSHGFSE